VASWSIHGKRENEGLLKVVRLRAVGGEFHFGLYEALFQERGLGNLWGEEGRLLPVCTGSSEKEIPGVRDEDIGKSVLTTRTLTRTSSLGEALGGLRWG
jgi:hypothetical protein